MDGAIRNDNNLFSFSLLSKHRNAIYGFAALWIVLFHYADMGRKVAGFSPKLDTLWYTMQMGNIGVDIFLFLSGMGLYYSFLKDSRILRFYYKRIIRVVLPFILLCIPYMTYLLASGRITVSGYFYDITTIGYWTGKSEGTDPWYVPAVLALYLIYPLIYKILFCRERGSFVRCLILLAVSVGVTLALWQFSRGYLYSHFDKLLPRVTVFILGCWCGKPIKEKKSYTPWLLLLAMTVVFFAYPLYTRAILSPSGGPKTPWFRYYGSLTGVMMVFLLAVFFEIFSSIRLDRFFAFFGAFSLEIYLVHIEARNWYMHSAYYGVRPLRDYSLLALGALVIAYLCSLIEKPIIRLLLRPVQKKSG